MRNVVLLEHVSLDGFVAGPHGEMDWINVDEELWAYVEPITDAADAAIYGRVTYQMMEGYWPTAAEKPGATAHDVNHSRWYKAAMKLVFSKTLPDAGSPLVRLEREVVAEDVARLKSEPGKNLLMLGSPSIAHAFMRQGLIDEYRINVNPVILGAGIALFPELSERNRLELVESKVFASGVVGLHYRRA